MCIGMPSFATANASLPVALLRILDTFTNTIEREKQQPSLVTFRHVIEHDWDAQ
jgi:hypothetical protein